MITHSSVIAGVLAVQMSALLLYNVAGMCVTGHLGAVFRTVLETTRTLFVWLVDLVSTARCGRLVAWLGWLRPIGWLDNCDQTTE